MATNESGRRVVRRSEAAPVLSAALAPVIARALEVGGGPPGLRKWVRSAAGGSDASTNHGLVRDLARRLADRINRGGLWGTLPDQHRQTLRPESPGLESRHPGEAGVGQAPDDRD